jgi:hypothetical protein
MDEKLLEQHTDVLMERLEGVKEKERLKIKGLLEDAIILILDYTARTIEQMNESLYYYARQLVVITWNQEGNEGDTARSEGGVSHTFITDIPDKLKSGLNNHRLGKVVSFYAPKET